MDSIFILAIALAFDLVLGDPPTYLHPVGWMGQMISFLRGRAPIRGIKAQFIYGIGIVLFGLAISAALAYLLMDWLHGVNRIAFIILGALFLKSTFSVRNLRSTALQIRDRLAYNDLAGARDRMEALVSRDTKELEEPLLAAATVESVAENTSDSIVAPLFWFLLLGVPGAVAYRMANTFDSMIGYHGKYEYLGKFAARLDDALNFIPARLTGLMFVLAAFISRKSGRSAWNIMVRDHARTESPNAGWPMSAVAGALEVELEKVGYYKLGEAKDVLTRKKILSVLHLMYVVVLIWAVVCFGIMGVRYVLMP